MILLDTSVLVASFAGPKDLLPALRRVLESNEQPFVPTVVLYEWWRGPRTRSELAIQESLAPSKAALPFGIEEASLAAKLYVRLSRARNREMDIAIAACAITHDAMLWTLNRPDFRDIPGLRLARLD